MIELAPISHSRLVGPVRPGGQNRGADGPSVAAARPAILIVEDEAVVARDLERCIEDMGYEVIASAATGTEALRVASVRRPDLILMDIRLRGEQDGIDTARAMQERHGMPIVYLTAFADEATLARAAETLPYGYVVKPFSSADVRCAIELALYKHAADRKLAIAARLSALGTMAAGVAHEINNPLTYVLMNLDRLVSTLESWSTGPVASRVEVSATELSDARRSIDEVVEGVERVRDIVADLSLFGRADDEPLQLVDVRDSISWALRVTAGQTHQRARVVTDLGETPLVRASHTRLSQVLVNLLMNAVQALPENRPEQHEIRVDSARDPGTGQVVIRVSDTGCGIPASELPRIFDPFYTTKDPGLGTGLGLSISHKIVGALGGSLTARSTVGIGSVFELTLPPASREAPPANRQIPIATAPGRTRILLVDDEPMLLSLMKRALEQEHEVQACNGAVEALEMLRRDPHFDLILTDMRMPGMSGFELGQQCRRVDPGLADRIAFMTGGSRADGPTGDGEEEAPVLLKPFTTAELLRHVRGILERRRVPA